MTPTPRSKPALRRSHPDARRCSHRRSDTDDSQVARRHLRPPTPPEVVQAMLKAAKVGKGDISIDSDPAMDESRSLRSRTSARLEQPESISTRSESRKPTRIFRRRASPTDASAS